MVYECRVNLKNKRKDELIMYLEEALQTIQKQDTEIKKLNKELEEWRTAYQEEKDKQFDILQENIKLKNVIDKLVEELRYQVGMGQQDMFCYDTCENKPKRKCTDEECRKCIKEYFMKQCQ